MAAFPARQAPSNSKHAWSDDAGLHRANVGADGLFTPLDAAEAAHADAQGWPVAKPKPAKPRRVKPKPAKPVAPPSTEPVPAEKET